MERLKSGVLEDRIHKIKQMLFFYDDRPTDSEVVKLVDEWRGLNKEIDGIE